jgi:spore coat polysaccharide biosynthesis protein SpsF (cytidylyltransferase family)
MKRRVVAIIQARLGSRRFPRKSVTRFRGRPMIEHVIGRVQQMTGVDDIVVTVPTSDTDLIRVVHKLNDTQDATLKTTRVVYGPENDVLWRYWLAATAYQADVVIRITGDCPLWSPRAGEEVLQAFLDDPQGCRYWSNDTTQSGWPDGTDVEVFSMDLLSRARHARVSLSDEDREHVTPWMKRTLYPDLGMVRRKVDHLSSLKLSVDTRSDLLALERLDAIDL